MGKSVHAYGWKTTVGREMVVESVECCMGGRHVRIGIHGGSFAMATPLMEVPIGKRHQRYRKKYSKD